MKEFERYLKLLQLAYKEDEDGGLAIYAGSQMICKFWGSDRYERATQYLQKRFEDCRQEFINKIKGGVK